MSTLGQAIVERARAIDILAVATRYGAQLRKNGSEFAGPCPVCGGCDRFSVNVRKRIWNCRGCGKGGNVITLVQHITGCDFTAAIEKLTGEKWPKPQLSDPGRLPAPSSSQYGARAGHIWNDAGPICGSIAEIYLQSRGIDLEQIPDIDDVLRFHRACPFGETRAPCLIALVRDAVTDTPNAIMRTALTDDGRKIDRKALGPIGGGAIKLWSDAAVTYGLVVGEGLETVAAAATRIEHKGAKLQPAWALVDAGNLENFPPLSAIEHLTILVDADHADKNGKHAGQHAADACTRRWQQAGRHITQVIPNVLGTDFADIVEEEARQ
jgi:hypothetical protein